MPLCETDIPAGCPCAWGTLFSMVALHKGPVWPGLQNAAVGLPAWAPWGLVHAGPVEESMTAQLGTQFLV